MHTVEADYLVVGAGAMGMAFVDTLITETDATVVLVDRNDAPGGHWLSAYPYVRLHQPSAYYGVNSRRLGNDSIDASGWNEGFWELAGGSEVVSYYDTVMRQHLLPSGRVQYFPMSDYLGFGAHERSDSGDVTGRFRNLGGDEYRVEVKRRVVDATYLSVVVPSMRPPAYEVSPDVVCIPPNGLARQPVHEQYVIVGAGKTSMDTCSWLLRHDIAPERITWIKNRESWILDRGAVQPGPEFARRVLADFSAQSRAIKKATSIDDLYLQLEKLGCLMRIDQSVEPTMYRCAILSQLELEKLRTITDVVRLGYVQSIAPGRVTLERGVIETAADTLYVDCTGDGIGQKPPTPVYSPGAITLQSVRTCQPAFSAAVIAHVEAMDVDDDERNEYCRPVPHPTNPLDWVTMTLAFNHNQLKWFSDPAMMQWLNRARLNAVSHMQTSDEEAQQGARMIEPRLIAASAKLNELLAQ
ncbi:NAD(P)-binding protein [Mycolicibacterium arenosum]|uniref:NAD(P)/FAD-dependent oxidoreductase n=1 Tax=Mycolicibacterium arenosum TaxID=2952157 RepID=A0ABT1M1A5_9MYCO|nr:NAD(P)/FAD-dependent oxidoreductase [Mycolicibacterium sp. CAU 1645]MCP9271632.1 NAD(P)/FAD-dependent oxidoreductase [Mycolicibacterium sp. CAU 1645]